MSDERPKGNFVGNNYAAYALDQLAQIIEDFPIKKRSGYTEAQVAAARTWVKEHQPLTTKQ